MILKMLWYNLEKFNKIIDKNFIQSFAFLLFLMHSTLSINF